MADDNGRLFPSTGAAFEATGAVRIGHLGAAESRLAPMPALLGFARDRIDAANRASGDTA